MYTLCSKLADARDDERGFTLPEVLLTVMFALYSIFDMSIRVITYALSTSGARRDLLRNGQPTVEFVEPGGLSFEYLNEFGELAAGETEASVVHIGLRVEVNGRAQRLATDVALRNRGD